MPTLPFLPIKRDAWNYDVDAAPHTQVYIICRESKNKNVFSALCVGSDEVSFVLASTTLEGAEKMLAETIENQGIEDIAIEALSWQTLGYYARGLKIDGEFVCLSGGNGWVASALHWTPTSNLCSDPYTLAVGCRVNGSWVTDKIGNPIINQDVPGLLAGIGCCDVECPSPSSAEFVTRTFFEWGADYTYLNYEGRIYDIKSSLILHPATQDAVFGTDPEEGLLNRLGVNDDTRGV